MPRPYPKEFREDVIRVARSREPDVRLKDRRTQLRAEIITWLVDYNTRPNHSDYMAGRTPRHVLDHHRKNRAS